MCLKCLRTTPCFYIPLRDHESIFQDTLCKDLSIHNVVRHVSRYWKWEMLADDTIYKREQSPALDQNQNSHTNQWAETILQLTCLRNNIEISLEQVNCNTSTLGEIKIMCLNIANGVDLYNKNRKCNVLWQDEIINESIKPQGINQVIDIMEFS